jgi:hypothetical protein
MQIGVKSLSALTDKQLVTLGESKSSPDTDLDTETREEMDRRLLELLGEVIRMSQAWVRALESGDPFTADKCEAECVFALERFEANRNQGLARFDSLEQTR